MYCTVLGSLLLRVLVVVNVSLENPLSDSQGISTGVLTKVKKNKVMEQV